MCRKSVFVLVAVVAVVAMIAAAPGFAGVTTCSTEWHTGSLAWVYPAADMHLMAMKPGDGNNIGDCLGSAFGCELLRCDTSSSSAYDCRDSAPVSHCIRYQVEECTADGSRTIPTVRQIELVHVGPCSVEDATPKDYEPSPPASLTCGDVFALVPDCVSASCLTETKCAEATGLTVKECKDCLASLADSGSVHSCAPFAGFCNLAPKSAIVTSGTGPKDDPVDPSYFCKFVDPQVPKCSEGCYTPRACDQQFGFGEDVCKTCLATEDRVECVFFGREIGWCNP